MVKESERFVAFGFLKDSASRDKDGNPVVTVGGKKISIKGEKKNEPADKLQFIKKKREELEAKDKDLAKEFEKELEKLADHEWVEVARDQVVMTDFPKSISRYYMGIESWHQSIEPYYYWCMNFLGDIGFPVIDKISDIFTAAEHSSFYGAAGQRLGLAQDKVSQYLATIGKMVKDLFQLVRELRWIDERLEVYREAIGHDKEGKPLKDEKGKTVGPKAGAENALKGMWVDLVDGVVGGQRTGSNLFVMSQQLQFTALPDLFFRIHPQEVKEVDKLVEEQAGEFNIPLRNLLKRKLVQYIAWKNETYKEMKTRRQFTLDYLRQHYNVIRMYMSWVKPYIKHIERLSGEQDLLKNPRLIAAFESSLIEIEVLARHKPEKSKKTYSCILLTFEYHTKPSMQYPGDAGYHRGPIHVGSTRITWRSYAWDDKKIKNYIAMRNREDIELLTSIDESLKSAMKALGDDLEDYLREAGEKLMEEKLPEKEKIELKGLMEPFTSLGKGVLETFGAFVPEMPKKKGKEPYEEIKEVESTSRKICWLHYNIFKKAHGLLAW
jgi:hypothetical protein